MWYFSSILDFGRVQTALRKSKVDTSKGADRPYSPTGAHELRDSPRMIESCTCDAWEMNKVAQIGRTDQFC